MFGTVLELGYCVCIFEREGITNTVSHSIFREFVEHLFVFCVYWGLFTVCHLNLIKSDDDSGFVNLLDCNKNTVVFDFWIYF